MAAKYQFSNLRELDFTPEVIEYLDCLVQQLKAEVLDA